MARLSDLVQRRSFGFPGEEGAMFDEMDYQNRLAALSNPRTITNESVSGQPQNYIQRTGGKAQSLGPSGRDVRVQGLPAVLHPDNETLTVYAPSGKQYQTTMSEQRAIEAENQRRAEMADLPRRMALAKVQEQEAKAMGGGLSPADQLAREKFEFEKSQVGQAGPKMTEAQAKATTFASQMAAASNELGSLENSGYDPSSLKTQLQTKLAGGAGNIATTQEAQRAKQAQNQWSEAFLRVKTGAAATQPEVELNNKTFFPQFGDSPQVIEQKRRMRLQAEQDVLNMAGGGRELATKRQAPQPSGNFDADKEARYQAWKAQQGR